MVVEHTGALQDFGKGVRVTVNPLLFHDFYIFLHSTSYCETQYYFLVSILIPIPTIYIIIWKLMKQRFMFWNEILNFVIIVSRDLDHVTTNFL